MQTFKEIFDFVLSCNEPVKEVIPEYKVILEFYDKEEYIYTTDLSIIKEIKAPGIRTELINEKDYNEYFQTMELFKSRAEYIWYLLLKDSWKNVNEEEFEKTYKYMWDEYYKIGGWDLVAENMDSFYKNNYST